MGIFSFFKNGGALGGMVQSVAESYKKLSKQSESELEAFFLAITMRYAYSPIPNKTTVAHLVGNRIKDRVQKDLEVGLFDLCYAIAQTEMDIKGIEDYTTDVIKKNLDNAGIPSYVQTGRRYSQVELQRIKQKYNASV